MKTKNLALVLLFTVISGCAVFDGGEVPKTTLVPLEDGINTKPTLSYKSIAMGGIATVAELPESNQSIISGELLTVLEESKYFSRIAQKDESAEISMEITLTNSGDPVAMIPAMITGFSLYTIPSWATDNFSLVAKVERKDGLHKEYVLADSTTLVQWLPMIFLFPVNNFSVIPDVRKNMYKKVLSDMKEDGFFSDSSKIAVVTNK